MIHDHDRSGYFGASDTYNVMADNRDTKTWQNFWYEKLGAKSTFTGNEYTRAGTRYEHPILEAIDEHMVMDGQLIIEDLKVRVNYDGWKDGIIYEVKTYDPKHEFRITDKYWMQVQVEMFVYKELAEEWFLPPFQKLYICSYPLTEADRDAAEPHVDPNKINYEEVKYDEKFIAKYKRRVKRLARKLRKALNEEDIVEKSEGDPNIDKG